MYILTSWLDQKLKSHFHSLTKKLFWIVKITVYFIINSDKQALIIHIHCFGYVFYHQNMIKKFCWFHRFLFCDLYFGFYRSNISNIYHSTKHLCVHYELLLQQHFIHTFFIFMLTTIIYQKGIHLGLHSKKFVNSNTICFIFHFTNSKFVWTIIVFWISRLIAKIKYFFILPKIFVNILVLISDESWAVTIFFF